MIEFMTGTSVEQKNTITVSKSDVTLLSHISALFTVLCHPPTHTFMHTFIHTFIHGSFYTINLMPHHDLRKEPEKESCKRIATERERKLIKRYK